MVARSRVRIDRLMQVDQLALLAQPVEELAEIFLHRVSDRIAVGRAAGRQN
jgi:hypothetical protein